jgi:hypothetical protein
LEYMHKNGCIFDDITKILIQPDIKVFNCIYYILKNISKLRRVLVILLDDNEDGSSSD